MSAHYSERQPSGCIGCLGIMLLCLAVDAAAVYAIANLVMFVCGLAVGD